MQTSFSVRPTKEGMVFYKTLEEAAAVHVCCPNCKTILQLRSLLKAGTDGVHRGEDKCKRGATKIPGWSTMSAEQVRRYLGIEDIFKTDNASGKPVSWKIVQGYWVPRSLLVNPPAPSTSSSPTPSQPGQASSYISSNSVSRGGASCKSPPGSRLPIFEDVITSSATTTHDDMAILDLTEYTIALARCPNCSKDIMLKTLINKGEHRSSASCKKHRKIAEWATMEANDVRSYLGIQNTPNQAGRKRFYRVPKRLLVKSPAPSQSSSPQPQQQPQTQRGRSTERQIRQTASGSPNRGFQYVSPNRVSGAGSSRRSPSAPRLPTVGSFIPFYGGPLEVTEEMRRDIENGKTRKDRAGFWMRFDTPPGSRGNSRVRT